MTVQYYLEKQRGQSFYRDIELILQHVLQKKRSTLYLSWEEPLTFKERTKIQKAVDLYKKGHPLAYILGESEFFGELFHVCDEVFIPRPETEILVETVLNTMSSLKDKSFYFMDFGCGSGCIGLSILLHFPHAHLFSVDSNKKALDITQKNAHSLKVSDRISLIHDDILNLNPADFPPLDFIVANPPYIAAGDPNIEKSVLDFEPASALFSKNKGLWDIKHWLEQAAHFLSKKTTNNKNQKFLDQKQIHSKNYFFEIGYNQKESVTRLLKNHPLILSFNIHSDLQGHPRIVHAQIKSSPI